MSAARKKKTKTKLSKPIGRPRSLQPNVTISFRVPPELVDHFQDMVDEEQEGHIGAEIKISALYNRAMGKFLLDEGRKIPGYNSPKIAAVED